MIDMGMVRTSFEQMEQLRECKSKMEKPLSRLVEEAVNHWLKFIAPAKLDILRVTPPTPVSKEQPHHRSICLGKNTEGHVRRVCKESHKRGK